VVKSPKFAGEVASGSPDYLKQVEKDKAAAKPAMPKSGMPGMKPPVAGPKGSKSELPAVYASVTSTTLTVKVPPDTQPVVLDLKSK
jgi:hypothetical protein